MTETKKPLTKKQREAKIKKEQNKTIKDVLRCLNEYGKCAMLRPTGFGKTYILTTLIHEYFKVLYVYPTYVSRSEVEKNYESQLSDSIDLDQYDEDNNECDEETEELINKLQYFKENNEIENCDMITYTKLAKMTRVEIINELTGYDLIILDEIHRTGGKKTKKKVDILINENPQAHLIGATATPTRMDNFDAVNTFFDDRMCYPYTLHNAIQDGILLKPNYYYCRPMAKDGNCDITAIKEDIDKTFKAKYDLSSDDRTKEYNQIITSHAMNIADLYNMDKIIKIAADKHIKDQSYMKFIVFFTTRMMIDEKLPAVEKWFKTAFPDHDISTLIITSKTKEETNNAKKLKKLKAKSNTIDIIACIDMVNMGHHVNDLTGLILYRTTYSNTIYTQQFGRALSIKADHPALIFDIPDNLHRKAIFDLRAGIPKRIARNNNGELIVHSSYDYMIEKTTNKIIMEDKNGYKTTIGHYNRITHEMIGADEKPIQTLRLTGREDEDHQFEILHKVTTIEAITEKTNASRLQSDDTNNETSDQYDLQMMAVKASLDEMMTKQNVEVMVQRALRVIEMHFYTWCEAKHVPFPPFMRELRDANLSKDDYIKEFKKNIKKNKITYPIDDLETLCKLGASNSQSGSFMLMCAKSNDVPINFVLKLMGLTDQEQIDYIIDKSYDVVTP